MSSGKGYDLCKTSTRGEHVKRCYRANALWTTYYRLLEDKALYQGVDASGVLPLLPTYKTSLEDYDSLMGVLTDDG